MQDKTFAAAIWSEDREKVITRDSTLPQGAAEFKGSQGVSLFIPIGKLLDTGTPIPGGVAYSGEPKRLPEVFGFSQKGEYLVLKDVVVHQSGFSCPGMECQKISAQSIISSRKPISSNPKIRIIEVEIPMLRNWVGDNPADIIHTIQPEKKSTQISFSFNSEDAKPIDLYKNEGVLIQAARSGFFPGTGIPSYNFSYEYDCKLRIEFLDYLPLLDDAIDKWVAPLWGFISFCLGIRPSIDSLTFIEAEEESRAQLYSPFTGWTVSIDDKKAHQIPFPLSYFDDGISNIVDKWINADGDIRRSANVLINMLDDWKMPINLSFFACASAFEALTRVNRDCRKLPTEEFQRRKALLGNLMLEEDVREWMLECVRDANRKSANDLAKELLADLGEYASYIVPDSACFLKEHRFLRNDHVHLKEASRAELADSKRLFIHTWATWLLAYGAVATYLGLCPGAVKDAIEKSRFMYGRIIQSRATYYLDDLKPEYNMD